ncbi:Hamartin protein-domain-containing protein [Bombardia bombarda]|uniref:Hamartin protein-domain-containing protein n=1 Tax=Bombardia bombarda TaxID=252184 RepID=A0AA39XPV4_9PEZI|nr:Hamartin protein-domain-containing protein [Bombardia bombarda]
MASSRSVKDLAKSLNSFFQAPQLPIPDELDDLIRSYLDKYQKFQDQQKSDDGAADRLNDEILSMYNKLVRDYPEKYAPFLVILRQLRPAIRTPARVFEWWDRLFDPVLDHVGQMKGLAKEALGNTLDMLALDEYNASANPSDTGLNPFTDRVLRRYMEAKENQPDDLSFVDFKETMLKEVLMVFGKKDPKGFMNCLDSYVVKRAYRNSALSLLCNFVQSQPPHLHLVLQTPLFCNILHSLQKDESTATVTVALVSVIMLLPFMPSSLIPFLPTLFNIYARLLFWDRDTYFAQAHTEIGVESHGSKPGAAWEKSLLDPDYDGSSISYLSNYFTILYGLYPINFVDYIRKPQRYLRHANNEEDIDVQAMEIRDRSERFQKHHLLHPNFYNLTIESEKTDLSRWIKSEADEVLADCMALSVQPDPAPVAIRSATPLPGAFGAGSFVSEGPDREGGLDLTLLGGSVSGDASSMIGDSQSGSHLSGRESLDVKTRELNDDSPTLPPHHLIPSSHTQLQDMVESNKAIKSGLRQSLTNDSVQSLLLSPQESAEKSSMQSSSHIHLSPDLLLKTAQSRGVGGTAPSVAAPVSADRASLLYHQSLLLRNDLQYERYLKQQHMTHMGELRRKQVMEAATEAETQNLVMANRSLKQRLDEAKRGEAQIKKEFDHRRNMTKKWESDLSAKLRVKREDQKKWVAEGDALKQQLETSEKECARLRRVVEVAEEKKLQSEQNLEAIDITTNEIDKLKAEITRLSAAERGFQGKELKMNNVVEQAEAVEGRVQQLSTQLAARDGELLQARRRHEAQLADLNDKLDRARKEGEQSKRVAEAVAVYEGALATSRTKHDELRKQYDNLMKKYTAVQATLLDLQSDLAERKGPRAAPIDIAVASTERLHDGEAGSPTPPMPRSPLAIRTRTHRGFSDPDTPLDGSGGVGISHNTTPPLDLPGSGTAHRPSTPLGLGLGIDSSGKTSPHSERVHGRGECAGSFC